MAFALWLVTDKRPHWSRRSADARARRRKEKGGRSSPRPPRRGDERGADRWNRAAWLGLIEETGRMPEGLGMTGHFLYIGGFCISPRNEYTVSGGYAKTPLVFI